MGNPTNGWGPLETLELRMYLITVGTESKRESPRDQRTFISLGGEICYFNHLLFEPKISPEWEKRKKCVVHFTLDDESKGLLFRRFLSSEFYKVKKKNVIGKGTN